MNKRENFRPGFGQVPMYRAITYTHNMKLTTYPSQINISMAMLE